MSQPDFALPRPTASYEADPENVHRVLLLYSGGLDTSVMLKWIQDSYEAEVVCLTVEGEHAREPRLFPLPAIDNASLLERAVLETGADDLFETALRSAGTLLG